MPDGNKIPDIIIVTVPDGDILTGTPSHDSGSEMPRHESNFNIGGSGRPPIVVIPTNVGGETTAEPDKK